MYGDGVRIQRAANGYTVEMRDPAIVKANRRRDLLDYKDPKRGEYQDPSRTYIFADLAKLTAFLTANLDKALPLETFESAFEGLTDDDED